MRRFLLLLFLSPCLLWAAPTFVNGAAVQCTSATTCSISYSPTSGNTVAICLAVNGSVTGTTVVDNAGSPVTLTAGSAQLAATAGTGIFYYIPGSSITQFTATWTTARTSTLLAVEYSGVSSVSGTPSAGTASGNSTAISVSPVANESGDFALACGARSSGTTQTANVGTIREEIHAASPGTSFADAVATGASATNVATTAGSSGTWTSSAIILRTSSLYGTKMAGPTAVGGSSKH